MQPMAKTFFGSDGDSALIAGTRIGNDRTRASLDADQVAVNLSCQAARMWQLTIVFPNIDKQFPDIQRPVLMMQATPDKKHCEGSVDLAENMKFLEELGGPNTYNHMPTGWCRQAGLPHSLALSKCLNDIPMRVA